MPFLGSCFPQQADNGLESEEEGTEQVSSSDGQGAADIEAAEVPEGEGELFEEGIGEAILPSLPVAFELARSELQSSTDPSERLQEIDRERPDPYAYVPVPPPPTAAPPAPEDSPTDVGEESDADVPADEDSDLPDDLSPALPDLPEPVVIASQVEVTGVVQLSGETYAIVKAPGEVASRYVKVGDRLSGGDILVKRIENRPGIVPVVILEERGMEIALPVAPPGQNQEGETALNQLQESSDIAALPFLP